MQSDLICRLAKFSLFEKADLRHKTSPSFYPHPRKDEIDTCTSIAEEALLHLRRESIKKE